MGKSKSSSSSRSRSHSPARRRRSRSRSRRSSSGSSSRSRSHSSDSDYDDGCRVHVGDLGIDCSKRELRGAFEKFGRILEVWVARSPPCFGFVVYRHREDADDAIKEMNGRTVCGCRVKVAKALPRRKTGRRKGFDPNLRCYSCGERGHFSRDCIEIWQQRRQQPTRSRSRSKDRKRRNDSSSARSRKSRSPARRDSHRSDKQYRSRSRERRPSYRDSRSKSRERRPSRRESSPRARERKTSKRESRSRSRSIEDKPSAKERRLSSREENKGRAETKSESSPLKGGSRKRSWSDSIDQDELPKKDAVNVAFEKLEAGRGKQRSRSESASGDREERSPPQEPVNHLKSAAKMTETHPPIVDSRGDAGKEVTMSSRKVSEREAPRPRTGDGDRRELIRTQKELNGPKKTRSSSADSSGSAASVRSRSMPKDGPIRRSKSPDVRLMVSRSKWDDSDSDENGLSAVTDGRDETPVPVPRC